jgi:flagellum-specific peptidoglycan hydrolase FlgJ
MKSRLCFSLLASIFSTFFLSLTCTAFGQSSKTRFITTDYPTIGDVEAVSARIAYLYDADEHLVQTYVQAAVDLESRTKIAASVIIAIAIHESSFNSPLFQNSGNPFGIKASKPWRGPTVSMWHDYEETAFRVYDSPRQAILDFTAFIKSRPWYADALACPMDDYYCVINGLKKSNTQLGYSLDPSWDETVLDIIYRMDLQPLTTIR